jgi:hypothetical protein
LNIDFVVSFADYLLNDQMDLQMCIFGMLLPVADVLQAEEDVNASIQHKNFSEFVKGMQDLNDFFTDLTPALETCKPLPDEAKFDLAALKNISGLKDLFHHVKTNIAEDTKELVLPSLKGAAVSCKAEDWMTCGQDLGQALHVLLIAPYPDEKLEGSKTPGWLDIDFVVNFLDYMLDDNNDLEMCIFADLMPLADVIDARTDLNASLHDHNITEFRSFLGDLHAFFETDLPSALTTCDVVSADANAVLQMISGVKSLKDLVKQMKKNYGNDPNGLILVELEEAFQGAVHKDHGELGQHLGALVHRLIVNTTYPDEKTFIV